MFGYVIPDKLNMYVKDYYVYKAHYCGLCKRIGKDCSQLMRFSTNYDIVFLDLLLHDLLGVKPVYNNEACILSPKKKSIAKGDEITDKVVDVNTLLMHYKLVDDKVDGGDITKSALDSVVVKSHYKKAKEHMPELDSLYEREYARLREYEANGTESMDKMCDPFANMMRGTIKYLLGEKSTSVVEELMYNLGKWIYIIDAVDDVDKDFKHSEFNPFFVDYKYENIDKFYEDNGKRIEFLLMTCYNRMYECFQNIELNLHEGALTNIVWYGILLRTKDIIGRKCEWKKIKI